MDRSLGGADGREGAARPQARVAGLSQLTLPSLEDVERRRLQLWVVTTVLLVVLAAVVTVVTLLPAQHAELLPRPVLQLATLALVAGFIGYAVEKELRLRRLAGLLVSERTASVALTNRLGEISALLDAGRAVNSAHDLATVLDAILRGLTELLPSSTCSVMLLEGNELRVVAAVGNPDAVGARMHLGAGIAGRVAVSQEPLLVNGRATPAAFPGLGPQGTAVNSAISVPLVQADELVGVLNVSAGPDHVFSEYDLRAVSLFAENASAAVAKAQLYDSSRRQAEELAHRAMHDALTDLPNRRVLAERTGRALETRADGEVALLFIDLDGFKSVNDALGHLAGDELLVAVARRITRCLRDGDLAARVGGDEFAVLVSDAVDERTALTVADRIVEQLRRTFVVGGRSIQVSASIGLAVAPRDGADFDALLRSADRALYTAKRSGKARWAVHDPNLPVPEQRGPAPDREATT